MPGYPDLFEIEDEHLVGHVYKVDSYSVNVSATDEDQLRKMNVNAYVLLHTADPNTRLVGRIDRVIRLADAPNELQADVGASAPMHNDVTIHALGTLKGPGGGRERPTFARAVETLPEIGAKCFLLIGEYFTAFTGLVADASAHSAPLTLGAYTAAPDARAVLDGNAFFQRHAMIVGSTGSGKSWTVATVIEQVADLPHSNMIVFDLHGEYAPLTEHPHIAGYRIAGPADLERPRPNVLFLPYWLLGYEDMLALILDRSDENAPNQAMAFSSAVVNAKRRALTLAGMHEELATFTIDSPVPYRLDDVVEELKALNEERVTSPGSGREINGPFNGRFSRFLTRLAAKRSDRRHGFLFSPGEEHLEVGYLDVLADKLTRANCPQSPGVKIIDFSEVPSDILPIVVSLAAKLVFQVQQWSAPAARHPIALVCDEAHLYLPNRTAADAAESRALAHFERIAKEGRKYGISLLIVSQRPSELNPTVMSQCHNVIALRLSNPSDKRAVSNLLPDNLGGIQELLPALGIGEAIVVGDACLLPSRINVQQPERRPISDSIRFWDEWSRTGTTQSLASAVRNFRRQSAEADH